MQVQHTIKKREGIWGIVKGDKGDASQVVPLSPLKKKAKNRIYKIKMITREKQRARNPKEMFR